MSQSPVKNLLHLVYSTKHRAPWIPTEVQRGLWAFLLFNRHEVEFDERYVWD